MRESLLNLFLFVLAGPIGNVSSALVLLMSTFWILPASGENLSVADENFTVEKIPITGCLRLNPEVPECTKAFTLHSPAPIKWAGMRERLNPETRILPPDQNQLRYRSGTFSKTEVQTVNLAEAVPKWVAMRFEDSAYKADDLWVKSVGNLLETFRNLGRNKKACLQYLERLESDYPRIWQEVSHFLPEWVRDDYLYADTWDPRHRGRPKAAENDGILERPPFLCPASQGQIYGQEYKEGETRKIFQASAPIYANRSDIMAAENDFQHYYQQKGANYLEVYPLKNSFFTGKNPEGVPFLIYDISFTGKPLPLWHIQFKLRQVLHYEGGRWQIENRLLEGDMNRLRLRIFYDPVYNTDGKCIGYVKTEWMDLDLKSLPDRDNDRIASLRGDIGNIKRMAESRNITSNIRPPGDPENSW